MDINAIMIFYDLPNIFCDIFGPPPKCVIEFSIDLVLDTRLISMAPYHMAIFGQFHKSSLTIKFLYFDILELLGTPMHNSNV